MFSTKLQTLQFPSNSALFRAIQEKLCAIPHNCVQWNSDWKPYSYLFRLSGMFVCVWAWEGEGRGRKEREEEEEEVEMIVVNSQMYSK